MIDGQQRPVRGAWVLNAGIGFESRARDERGQAKERIGMRIAFAAISAPRSDAKGLLVVPVQDWQPMGDDAKVRIRAGTLQSEPIPLAASPDEQTVVIK